MRRPRASAPRTSARRTSDQRTSHLAPSADGTLSETAMTLLTVTDIHKSHRGRHLLRGVSLVIQDGERLGLLGPNGSGKSTLLRILAGTEEADSGERVLRRDLRLGYLEQEPKLPADARVRDVVRSGLPGREAVLADLAAVHAAHELAAAAHEAAVRGRPGVASAGSAAVDVEGERALRALLARQSALEDKLELLGGHDVEHRVEELLEHLGLPDAEALCGTLSGGEARRAALARLLLGDPELMLLDEPTNHLDAEVITWLEGHLLARRTPLLMVTHDRYVLDRVADRIIELDRGTLVSYVGGYGDYLLARAEADAREQHAEGSRQNLLRRETAWMRRGPPARTTKAKARIDRYEALAASAPERRGDTLEFRVPEGPRLGVRVIRLQGARKSRGDKLVIPGIDVELAPGERLGIVGPNGAGKTTLIQLCTGALAPDAGSVSIGDSVVFAGIDQQRTALNPDNSVLKEIAGPNQFVKLGDRAVRIESFLEQFLFPGEAKHALIGTLSGGERNRVLLGKLLCAGGNVLVLDEPTNDLDLMTLRALEEALCAFEGCVLVVSHDRWFLDRVATRIVHLDGKGGVRIHSGDLSGMLSATATERPAARAAATAARESAAAGPTGAAPPVIAPGKPRRLSPWELKECDALPARIESAEAELSALDARLADPALWRGPAAERERLTAQHASVAANVARLTVRWEELEGRR